MNVYQANYDGYYVGTLVADPDPLMDGQFLVPAGSYTDAPQSFDPATQRAKRVNDAWVIEDIPVVTPDPTPTAAELLEIERAAMNPYLRAFRAAMKIVSATGFLHLLDKVDLSVAAAKNADPYADLVIWAESVQQIVRGHPDMTAFADLFGQSPLQVDALCRIALAIEASSPAQEIADLQTAYEAL